MSSVPPVPSPPRSALQQNLVQQYHQAMRPWFEQIQQLLGSLTLADNHGAASSETAQVTAGADGVLSGVVLPCSFRPLLVFWRAEVLDSGGRGTGVFGCGFCQWDINPKSAEQGVSLTKAVGLLAGTYSVTFLALPG